MPQTSPLAELIKQTSAEWKESIGGPVTSNNLLVDQDTADQAKQLIKADTDRLAKFGKNFQIPKRDQLAEHLKKVEFNHFLAEPLLREGSLLLDRCLQQRRDYEELQRKWFEACIQVEELFE